MTGPGTVRYIQTSRWQSKVDIGLDRIGCKTGTADPYKLVWQKVKRGKATNKTGANEYEADTIWVIWVIYIRTKKKQTVKKEKVPIRPKQTKMRTDPEAETTQGENAESQSQPKNGVATTKVEYYEWYENHPLSDMSDMKGH